MNFNSHDNVDNILSLKAYPLTDANISESDYLTLKFCVYIVSGGGDTYHIQIGTYGTTDNDMHKLFGYDSNDQMTEDIYTNNAKPICHFEFMSGDNFKYYSIDD